MTEKEEIKSSFAKASAFDKSSADKSEDEGKINTEDLKKKGDESKDSSSPIADTRELEEYQKLKDEYLAGWQRVRADFLNYKKEEMERIGELLKYAAAEFILRILPVLDNFEIVEKKLPENLKNDENIKGLLQVKIQLQDFLKSQGLEEVKTVGEALDLNLHEVIEEIEPSFAKASADAKALADKLEGKEIKSGIIVEEIQKGYKINGRLLRPAKVKVIK